jgi:histidine triad (HIT) family protein
MSVHSCIFCKIIQGELPSSIVHEDEHVIAFLDINPINPGHVLIVPKQHYASLKEVPTETAMQLFKVVLDVEKAVWIADGVRCEGTNLLQNNGKSAWQDVFHVHFHVIPRYKGDNFKIKIEAEKPSREELDTMATHIRNSI